MILQDKYVKALKKWVEDGDYCFLCDNHPSSSHDSDCPLYEKLINGIAKEEWVKRYASYLKAHSNAEYWICEESASVAWDESTDENPEDCAEEELTYWE